MRHRFAAGTSLAQVLGYGAGQEKRPGRGERREDRNQEQPAVVVPGPEQYYSGGYEQAGADRAGVAVDANRRVE